MIQTISPTALGAYVDAAGTACPYCGSEELDRAAITAWKPRGRIEQCVRCACGQRWTDVYQLVRIEPTDQT